MSAVAIIPCLNERAHIAGLIERLLADRGWDDPLVLVADGGSTDGTRQIVTDIAARDPRVRLVDNPARLQSAGVNTAARSADGCRWLVRVDAHASYPPDYVSTLVSVAERTGADSVVAAMETRGVSCFQKAAAAAQNSVLGNGGSAHRAGGVEGFVDHGHHALFDRQRFLALGGYDESFSHNEDAELDARLTAQGGRIWMTREASLIYYPRDSFTALLRQYLNYGAGRARTLLRHRAKPKLRQLAPAAVAPALVMALAAPIWGLFALPALLWLFACLAFGVVLGLREKSLCAAGAGVAALAMHLGWSLGFWRRLLATRAAPAEPARLAERAS